MIRFRLPPSPPHQGEQQGQNYANYDRGHQWEVKGEIAPAHDYVAGQVAQARKYRNRGRRPDNESAHGDDEPDYGDGLSQRGHGDASEYAMDRTSRCGKSRLGLREAQPT